MTRIVKAELIRLVRRRTVAFMAAGAVLLSLVAALTTLMRPDFQPAVGAFSLSSSRSARPRR